MKNILPVIIMALVMFFGSMLLQPETEPSVSEEPMLKIDAKISVPEIYEELMNEETRKQYEKMESQMDDYFQKKEEHHRRWMLMIAVCAVLAVIPIVKMFILLLRHKLGDLSVSDVFYILGVCIGSGILFFVINLTGTYLMFFAERSVQILALSAILFCGGAALWYTSFKSKKKEPKLTETTEESD